MLSSPSRLIPFDDIPVGFYQWSSVVSAGPESVLEECRVLVVPMEAENQASDGVVLCGGRVVRPGERQPKLSTTVPCFAYKRKRIDSNEDAASNTSRKTLTYCYLCGQEQILNNLVPSK